MNECKGSKTQLACILLLDIWQFWSSGYGKTDARFNGCFSKAMEAASPNLICGTDPSKFRADGRSKNSNWCVGIKYDNLQYDMLGRWVLGRATHQPSLEVMEAASPNLICGTDPSKFRANRRSKNLQILRSACNLKGSVSQIKSKEGASITFEKYPLKRASVFP